MFNAFCNEVLKTDRQLTASSFNFKLAKRGQGHRSYQSSLYESLEVYRGVKCSAVIQTQVVSRSNCPSAGNLLISVEISLPSRQIFSIIMRILLMLILLQLGMRNCHDHLRVQDKRNHVLSREVTFPCWIAAKPSLFQCAFIIQLSPP
jgi:hypothetical protein